MRLMTTWIVALFLVGCGQPAVQVTPTVESGVVAPGAVKVDPNAVTVRIADSLERIEGKVTIALKAIQQTAQTTGTSTAGHDATQTQTTVTLDGSGWPLVGVGALAIAAVVGWVYYVRRAKLSEGWLTSVAGQVKAMPKAERDTVLEGLAGNVPDEAKFKAWLDKRQLRADKEATDGI